MIAAASHPVLLNRPNQQYTSEVYTAEEAAAREKDSHGGWQGPNVTRAQSLRILVVSLDTLDVMKAVVIPRFSGLEVLEVRDVPLPNPSPQGTLVKVKAAA